MNIKPRNYVRAIQYCLPTKIQRGPFTWELAFYDGIAVSRAADFDGVSCLYIGTNNTRLYPTCLIDADFDPRCLARAAEEEADKAYSFFKGIHELFNESTRVP